MPNIKDMNEPYHRYEWVISHVWMSHITRHVWMSHVTRMIALSSLFNNLCLRCAYQSSHKRMRHVTHMNEPCRTYIIAEQPLQQLLPEVRMSNTTHMNGSFDTYGWVMSQKWMSRVTCVRCRAYSSTACVWGAHANHFWKKNQSDNYIQTISIRTLHTGEKIDDLEIKFYVSIFRTKVSFITNVEMKWNNTDIYMYVCTFKKDISLRSANLHCPGLRCIYVYVCINIWTHTYLYVCIHIYVYICAWL